MLIVLRSDYKRTNHLTFSCLKSQSFDVLVSREPISWRSDYKRTNQWTLELQESQSLDILITRESIILCSDLLIDQWADGFCLNSYFLFTIYSLLVKKHIASNLNIQDYYYLKFTSMYWYVITKSNGYNLLMHCWKYSGNFNVKFKPMIKYIVRY